MHLRTYFLITTPYLYGFANRSLSWTCNLIYPYSLQVAILDELMAQMGSVNSDLDFLEVALAKNFNV